jgi:CBS domain-containing protein
MNDTWRMPLSQWRQCFLHWIEQPEPKALMLTSVFFDMRAVHGQADLLDALRRDVLHWAHGNGIFLAHLVRNALTHTPPLGLWGRLQTARSGEHRGTIDLKHRGLVPIIDLARVYALAGQVDAVNTLERLSHGTEGGEVSVEGARDLVDTWTFLADVRIQHQKRQIERGEAPDNFLRPNELSNFERQHLKQAFATIGTLQEALGQRHQAGRL